MADYLLIIKAEETDSARAHIDEWLGIPQREVKTLASLGYNEVMASISTDELDLTIELNDWLNETKPRDGQPFLDGALIWWKS